MKIPFYRETTIPEIADYLTKELPQYMIEVKKNPLFRFEFVEVRKSGFVGAWISIKKDGIRVDGCIPSTMARAFLGGLLVLLITMSGRRKVVKAVAEALENYK